MMKGLGIATIGVIIDREKKGEFHVQWTSDAEEKLSEGDGANVIQTKEEIHINNAWESGSDMFFMELVLTDAKLLVFMEVEGNPIFLISKVLDVFENLAIRKRAVVLRAPAVV